jgi:hypothetical protein
MDQSADFTKFAKTKLDDCCTNDLKVGGAAGSNY